MRALWTLSLRTHRRRPGRPAVVLAGIALGVAVVVAVGLVNATYLRDEAGAIGRGGAQLVVRALDPNGMPEAIASSLDGLAGVVARRSTVETATVAWSRDAHARVRVLGAAAAEDAAVRSPSSLAGRPLDAGDERAVVLGRGLAAALAVGVGEEVELFTPDGVMPFVVVGIEDDRGADALGASVALLPLRTVQALFATPGLVDTIDVMTRPGGEPEVRRSLAGRLAGVAAVEHVLELQDELTRASHGLRFMVALAAAMAVVAAACLVLANAVAGLDERREAIALLWTLGEPRRRLRAWLTAEALAFGIAGSALGVPLGMALALWWSRLAPAAPWLPGPSAAGGIAWSAWPLALGVAVGVASAAGAAVPVWRAAVRARPGAAAPATMDSVRWGTALAGAGMLAFLGWSVGPRGGGGALTGLAVGVALSVLAVACAAVPGVVQRTARALAAASWAPVWARLAAGRLRRDASLASAAAVALTATVAVAVGVVGTVGAFERSLDAWTGGRSEWDARVTVGRSVLLPPPPLRAEAVDAFARLPGVEAVAAERVSSVRFGDGAVTVHAIDLAGGRPARSLDAKRGPTGSELVAALAQRGGVAISAGLASRTGLGPGDSVALGDPNAAVVLPVVAVVADPGPDGRAVFMDRRLWASAFGDETVDTAWLALAPDGSIDAVRGEITAQLGERYRFEVVGLATLRRDAAEAVRDGFGMAQVLVVLAVLVALCGAVNAGLAAAWSWRRDVALLRALGAAPRLVGRTLAAEAAVVTVVGGLLGAAVGTVLTAVLLDRVTLLGTRVTAWSWPVEAYVAAAVVAVLAALMAAVPAQAARREPLAQLLRPE